MKQQLDGAAQRSGRSQSTEAAVRLERSFDRTFLMPEALSLAFGPRTAGLLLMLGMAMEDAGYLFLDASRKVHFRKDGHWSDHPHAFDCALLAVVDLLISLRAVAQSDRGPDARTWEKIQSIAPSTADTLVRDVRGEDVSPSSGAPPWCNAETIRSLLGPAFVEDRLRRPSIANVESARRLIAAMLRGSQSVDEEEAP